MSDLKFALRQLVKNPGFTAVAVLTLALGIGANTAIFQLLNAVRLKTLPVSKPQELIEARMVGGNPGIGISDGANAEMTYPLWDQLQNHREAFSGLFAWSSGDLPIGNDVETRMVRSLWASGEFFSVLGVAPFRGRLIQADDDWRGAGPGGVVISYAFWQSEFGGQDSAVGKSLTLGDRVLQKLQAPEKLQIQSSKPVIRRRVLDLNLGAWGFSGAWCLGFGIWDFGFPSTVH
jgi:putative ABC transport system permease protein